MNYNSDYSIQDRLSYVMARVYGWMSCALAITAGVAFYIFKSPAIFKAIFSNPAYVIALMAVQIGIVISIAFLLQRMSFITAFCLFILYAASVGITMSAVFYSYTDASIYAAFFVTAGMFGAMSIYGYVTKADLTSIGNMSMMLLFGMILTMFINMFLQSPALAYWISAVGVFVFTLLTAYDTQKIKQIALQFAADRETTSKIALFGALSLYLDFINLFLSLLQFMGRRRD